jgi:hypothetical protein
MGQITDVLDDFFVFLMLYFIEKYGKQDRRREPPKKAVRTDEKGVSDQLPEIGIKKKLVEMFKSCPWAAHDSLHDVEILEGQYNSV